MTGCSVTTRRESCDVVVDKGCGKSENDTLQMARYAMTGPIRANRIGADNEVGRYLRSAAHHHPPARSPEDYQTTAGRFPNRCGSKPLVPESPGAVIRVRYVKMLAVALSILATLFFLGLLFVILAISVYNQLNESLRRCENAYAQLNVHSKRRYELIPPLIDKLRDVPGIDPTILQATTSTCQTAQAVDQGADGGLKDREAFARSKDAEAELDSATHNLACLWKRSRSPPRTVDMRR